MPAFGTTNRTYQNSLTLMQTLGITVKEIPIKDACITHYADIGHDMEIKDITYENVQARERTQVLMDYAIKSVPSSSEPEICQSLPLAGVPITPIR